MASDDGEDELGTAEDDEGPVLSPDELDITEDERVAELEEGRYVISADESTPRPIENPDHHDADAADAGADPGEIELDGERVHAWLADSVGAADAQYGFDVTATFEDRVVQEALFSNDVVTTFENLVVWYARHVGGDTPVEDVLGILLTETRVPVRYPDRAFDVLLDRYDLDGEDSIAELRTAVERDGFRFD